MFRISVLVEDKKLPQALTVLNGLCFNMEVQPVTNATVEPKTRKVRETGEPTGKEMILTLLEDHWNRYPDIKRVKSLDLIRGAQKRWPSSRTPQLYFGIREAKLAGILSDTGIKGEHNLHGSKFNKV